MKVAFRVAALISVSILLTGSAEAQQRRAADPDWPCFQIKTPNYSLAAVWDGPPIDLESEAWRDDPEVVDLAEKMADRRTPVSDVEAAIAAFAKSGAEARKKLPIAFGAAFQSLTSQRSQIIDGLDRFGRRQRELADQIRSENETAQSSANATPDGAQYAALQKLQWDMRLFEERRREVSYACESTTTIEQRIGALARAVRATM
jgi:hypothetical protein